MKAIFFLLQMHQLIFPPPLEFLFTILLQVVAPPLIDSFCQVGALFYLVWELNLF
jgi:hypothetical protein